MLRVMTLARLAVAAALSSSPAISLAQSQGLTSDQSCRTSNIFDTACTVSHVNSATLVLSTGTAENNFNSGVGDTGRASILLRNRAAYGDLGLALEGDLQVTIGPNGFAASALAFSDVSFFDTLRVTSALLPAGTPVSVRLSGNLSGSETTTSSLGPGFQQTVQRNLVARLRVNNQQVYGVGYGSIDQVAGVTRIDTPNYSFSTLLNTTVGADLSFYGTMTSFINISIGALGVGNGPPISGSLYEGLIAFNSAHTFADVLTPGVSLVAQSGVSYVTPVPEVSTWILMALGMSILLARRSSFIMPLLKLGPQGRGR